MSKFTDIEPLTYYYMHGYKIMNPLCRILAEKPTYRLLFESLETTPTLMNSVTVHTMQELKSMAGKGWDLLKVDEEQVTTMLTGDASGERKGYLDSGFTQLTAPSEVDIRKATQTYVADQIRSLWQLCIDTKRALLAKPPASCEWAIRGDGNRAAGYLASCGARFTPHFPSFTRFNRSWETNQFWSTSEGDELASVAGRAVVWVIRLKPGAGSGRMGGVYTSESEILFPYGVSINLEGGVNVESVEQIDGLNLKSFVEPEELRKKLRAVFVANNRTHAIRKMKFLVASE